MRSIFILSVAILIFLLSFSRFQPESGLKILDAETIVQINRELQVRKILWAIMTVLQVVLLFKLFKFIPRSTGLVKSSLLLYTGIVCCLLMASTFILFIGMTSFYM